MKHRKKSRRLPPEEARYWRLWRIYCLKFKYNHSDSQVRHYCHERALGYDKSHKHFSHKEYDLVYAFLIDRINGLDPEPEHRSTAEEAGERRRKIYRILEDAPWAYVQHVAKGKFACNDWRNLPLPKLEQLRITIIERSRAKARKGQNLYDSMKEQSHAR